MYTKGRGSHKVVNGHQNVLIVEELSFPTLLRSLSFFITRWCKTYETICIKPIMIGYNIYLVAIGFIRQEWPRDENDGHNIIVCCADRSRNSPCMHTLTLISTMYPSQRLDNCCFTKKNLGACLVNTLAQCAEINAILFASTWTIMLFMVLGSFHWNEWIFMKWRYAPGFSRLKHMSRVSVRHAVAITELH